MRTVILPEYDGPIVRGVGGALIDNDTDLIRNTKWSDTGFAKVKFLDESGFACFRNSLERLVFARVREGGIQVPESARLEDYHRYVKNNREVHGYAARWGLPLASLDIDSKMLCDHFSEICGTRLRLKLIDLGEGRGPEEIFGYRVIRPKADDHNPLHRDGWLDIWKHTLNVWVPIAGCDGNSSLQVIPGSHRWNEEEIERTPEGAEVYGKRYHVPAVVAVHRAFEAVIPNPSVSEALVFSPFLIHGRGENHNSDITRVSVELRFEVQSKGLFEKPQIEA